MRPSIRTFLLINLLLSITLITSLSIIGNLFLEHRELQLHLDARLTQAAFTIESFTSHQIRPGDYLPLQKAVNREAQKISQLLDKNPNFREHSDYSHIRFQIWGPNKQLLLQSMPAISENLSMLPDGLSEYWINGQPWRVFATLNEASKNKIIVAERYDFRDLLEGRIARNSIIIMLIAYPFLGLLIWLIVGRGLSTLKSVAYEVSHRAPTYLRPVDLRHVPVEIVPVIEELNQLLQRVHDALDREKRFAADAAHELRTPLAALKAHTQVALLAHTEEERTSALKKVLEGVDRSAHVVQQLLIMSRMSADDSFDKPMPVDFVQQAKIVISELVADATKKDSEIELLAKENISKIMGNPTAISIMMRNLIDNAIRYSPEKSVVKVGIEEVNNKIIFTVTDNGPGIPEELHERIFERFYRILGNKSSGSGLGLGIVQKIAKLHRAEIKLGKPEQGNGFKISIIFEIKK